MQIDKQNAVFMNLVYLFSGSALVQTISQYLGLSSSKVLYSNTEKMYVSGLEPIHYYLCLN